MPHGISYGKEAYWPDCPNESAGSPVVRLLLLLVCECQVALWLYPGVCLFLMARREWRVWERGLSVS